MAVVNYEVAYGSFPPAYIADESGRPMHSWRVLLLPFLEQRELYNAYNFAEPWDGPNNRQLLARRPIVYAFHGDASDGGTVTNYLAAIGPETIWPGATTTKFSDIRDGSSVTILVAENEASGIQWTEPRDLDFSQFDRFLSDPARYGISSKFAPPIVAMADGTVRSLPLETDSEILRALFTVAGQERIAENLDEIMDGRLRPRK